MSSSQHGSVTPDMTVAKPLILVNDRIQIHRDLNVLTLTEHATTLARRILERAARKSENPFIRDFRELDSGRPPSHVRTRGVFELVD